MLDSELIAVLASELADATGWKWQPAGPAYATGEVGIYYGNIDSSPDQAVGLKVYAADDPRVDPASRRVQVRYRGRPGVRDDADNMADAAYTALDSLVRTRGLSLVSRVLVAQLGTDANSRLERADSYLITLDNPEAVS